MRLEILMLIAQVVGGAAGLALGSLWMHVTNPYTTYPPDFHRGGRRR